MLLLPPLDPQKSGMRQPLPVSQSGPVHIQAPVGFMSPELVKVEIYVTEDVVPSFDTGMIVIGITVVDEPCVVVITAVLLADVVEVVLGGPVMEPVEEELEDALDVREELDVRVDDE